MLQHESPPPNARIPAVTAHLNRMNPDVQAAGYAILVHLFNGGAVSEELRRDIADLREKRGVGCDMTVTVEDVRKWVELKAHAREAQAGETLTQTEYLRAEKEGANFYLAVVSGLLEGYETTVQLYRNPLKTAVWTPTGAVYFTGLAKATHHAYRISHEDQDGES